jgi:hypothetical protein
MKPFLPGGATVNIDVSSSTGAVQIAAGDNSIFQVRVMNNGTATAWIAFGTATLSATTTAGIPIGPGVTEVFSVSANPVWVAAIAAGSTGKIYFTPGSGI